MQFTLSADGTLKHHCSGKMVCPRKPAQGKRCELMISSKCQPQDAKFERTAGMISKFARTFVLKLEFIIIILYHPPGKNGRPTVPSNMHVSLSLPLLSPRSSPLFPTPAAWGAFSYSLAVHLSSLQTCLSTSSCCSFWACRQSHDIFCALLMFMSFPFWSFLAALHCWLRLATVR